MKIVVLMGGTSDEREVSLMSGKKCAEALEALGHQVTRVDAVGRWPDLLDQDRPDAVLNILHGGQGENGTVQALLEHLELPYSHSGILASALAMDKQRSKHVYRNCGIPIAHSILLKEGDLSKGHPMDVPYVLKPVDGGSSVGVTLIRDISEAVPQVPETALMAEAYVPGREFTVTVLQDKPLTVTEIVTDRWYDYDAKYSLGQAQHVLPAAIPTEIFDACMEYALQAHQALGCRGISRSDFRWDDTSGMDGLFILETNTQPGMTPTSLAPEQAAFTGMDFPTLCEWLVKDASVQR